AAVVPDPFADRPRPHGSRRPPAGLTVQLGHRATLLTPIQLAPVRMAEHQVGGPAANGVRGALRGLQPKTLPGAEDLVSGSLGWSRHDASNSAPVHVDGPR